MRWMGMSFTWPWARSSMPLAAWMSVSMMPGRTPLTRMPSLMSSRPRPLVSVSTAPLVAA